MAGTPSEVGSRIRYSWRSRQEEELAEPCSLNWGFGFSPKMSGETLVYWAGEGQDQMSSRHILGFVCRTERKGKVWIDQLGSN